MATNTIDYRIHCKETLIIKAIAIIAMLVHHLFYEHPEFGSTIVNIGVIGKICVFLFVFLSGYGMTASFPYVSGNFFCAKRFFFFLCRRFTKFFFNYWFIFFISIPTGVLLFDRPLQAAYGVKANLLKSFVKDFFGQQGLFSYNETWWFNAVIIALWIMFPFLYMAMKNKVISICILIFLWMDPYIVMHYFHFVATGLATYIFPFILGIFFALRINQIRTFLNKFPPYIVLYTSLIMAILFLIRCGFPIFPNYLSIPLGPVTTLLIALAVVSLCRATNLQFGFMQFVGKHSMNMYLTHTFIFGYFFHDFIYGFKHPVLIFLVLFMTSLLLSICIEFAKRRIGFYKLQGKVVETINRIGCLVPKEHDNAH